MGRTIGIDFEATYHKGVRGASEYGPLAYAMHPETEVWMASVDTGDEVMVGLPEDIPWEEITQPGDEWVSHNRTFDSAVYERLVLDRVAPLTKPKWHCSADLAAYLGIQRGLETSARYLLGVEVDKSFRNNFNNKTKKEIVEYMWDDAVAYASEDATLTREIWVKYQHFFPEHERWLSEHTTMICHRGVGIDLDFADKHITRLKDLIHVLEARMPWMEMTKADGKFYTARSPHGLKKYCEKVEIEPPANTRKDSPEFDAWVARVGDQADFAKALGEYRSADRTLGILENCAKRTGVRGLGENTMPFGLKYFGTHHSRWSGDGGVNVHNPPRKKTAGVMIRHLFIPRFPDNVMIAADLSQIEARVLLWEVRDEDQLEMVRQGMDVYESHARKTMGYDDPRPMKHGDPDGRTYAKVRVLQLGYKSGWKAFKAAAWSQYGLDISTVKAKVMVKDYRRKNPAITRYWNARELAVVEGSRKNGGDYFEELPDGNFLYYRDVKRVKGRWLAINQMGMGHRSFHGGLLTQNRVSAIARSILGEAMRKIEPIAPILFHMHDEVVCEVPRRDAEDIKLEIEDLLTQVPEWTPGLPIACEAQILERYAK